ncbi:hypothetical protein MKX57_15725 [Lysinibacillus sp. FSL M8-0216]|nr:hypothetical protein [Lysinibacillus fusiformis]MCG7437700.1 hypothetical protein [Lysinibacillus fusiformis]HAU34959.1 hypothetical protein [Lysinibacillus sp.]
MSMATYIGLNFTVKLNEYYTEDEVEIDYVFSKEKNRNVVKQKHFTTPYIYEVSEKGHPIWEMNEYQKTYSPHNYEKSKITFLYLCHLLKGLLPQGDFCEVFICWLGEEDEKREDELKINLNDLQIEAIDIYEKCFIRIEN